jgi:Mce-associated membrane protein
MTTVRDNTEATMTRDEETVDADANDSAETMPPDVEPTAEDETTQEDSEIAEAEAEPNDEADEESATTRVRRPIAWSRVLAYGVLPGVALLLAVAAGYFKWADGSAADVALARTESVRVASEDAVALLSYKADSADKDLNNAARDRLTGEFKDAYLNLIRQVVIPGAKEKHISSTVKVSAAAPVSTTSNHSVVLLYANQTVTIGEGVPTDTQPVIRVTLDKVDGRWLVSRFDPV